MLFDSLQNFRTDREKIRAMQNQIYVDVLRKTKHIDRPNFSTIHPVDLERIFDLYDEQFFDGGCRDTLRTNKTPISFRLSSRMTRAGGKTTRHELVSGQRRVATSFEIAISTTLLFETFRPQQPNARVAGLECKNRLQAMMRIVEHEMVHLIEMLLWWDSNCMGPRFRKISNRFFEHRESNHQLITPDERAKRDFGIGAGDEVSFRYEGRRYRGVVNRITRRATVLVEHPKGTKYNDGKYYQKFYIPISKLTPIRPAKRRA